MRVYKRKHLSARRDTVRDNLECDDLIIGSGAGAGQLAYKLSTLSRKVLVIEEGELTLRPDFNDNELKTYKSLYQEQLARATKDKRIKILQGKSVGGSTTINWTSSFRTPQTTLSHWRKNFGLNFDLYSDYTLEDSFSEVEKLYGIKKWQGPINKNNGSLLEVCKKNNWSYDRLKRNVNGCASTGLCGFGCPINAKQSTLINTLPKAMENGDVSIISELKAWSLEYKDSQIKELTCLVREKEFPYKVLKTIKIQAKRFFLCAGAIGSPAIALRSKLHDPFKLIGKRTFLHPTIMSVLISDEVIEGAKGAPQTIYSNEFIEPTSEHMGLKLEVGPTHPVLAATTFDSFGEDHLEMMKKRKYMSAQIALLRDGLNDSGGSVELSKNSLPLLNYPITDYLKNSAKRALKLLSAAQLNAGARAIVPGLMNAHPFTKTNEVHNFIEKNSDSIKYFSAHVMGGLTMGSDPKISVVNTKGRSHHYENLYVMDGSLFPTSIGANPMESIFGIVNYLSKQFLA